ncbi:hypothetical protein BSL78_03192 [Apostichopus japonicus]|uniref:Fibrinogen C-terminal domain-containing protein n=1 Tax=Stichopus japonicus TaxID=307972 RepID=A0A2G8LI20_STIJA|nr:hypothetical protein BSL78_03192 [Apostichopus japonicus]
MFMESETDGERKEEFTSLKPVTRNVLVRIIIFRVTIVINAILTQIVKKGTVSLQCYCPPGYSGDGTQCRPTGGTVPSDCKELYNNGERTSGVYEIKPTIWPDSPFEVYCNMSDGGGWTVFQRRVDASQDFYLYWDDYKSGFGNRSRNFWLGNEKIYSLTNQRQYELRIDIVDYDGDPYYAKYEFFRISDENDNFRLDVGNYSDGDAESGDL